MVWEQAGPRVPWCPSRVWPGSVGSEGAPGWSRYQQDWPGAWMSAQLTVFVSDSLHVAGRDTADTKVLYFPQDRSEVQT